MASNRKTSSKLKPQAGGTETHQPPIKKTSQQALPYERGVSPTAVDVTGITPEDVHPEPDITEGHPGYAESGSSELRPPR
jgi:hypothetical protein